MSLAAHGFRRLQRTLPLVTYPPAILFYTTEVLVHLCLDQRFKPKHLYVAALTVLRVPLVLLALLVPRVLPVLPVPPVLPVLLVLLVLRVPPPLPRLCQP